MTTLPFGFDAVTMRECDPVQQQKRQDFLEWLYECSGRQERGDWTYTGLYEEYLKNEAARLNEEPCH